MEVFGIAAGLLILVVIFTIKGMVGSRNRDVRRVMPVRIWVWRFITGQHLDGVKRTNCTFRYRGDVKVGTIVKATNWEYRPGYQRLLIRLAWILLILVTPVVFFLNRSLTQEVMTILAIVFVGYYIARLTRALFRYRLNRRWINPLHNALARTIGRRSDESGEDYIHLPFDFRTDPAMCAEIDLPDKFDRTDTATKTAIKDIVEHKLGLYDLVVELQLKSTRPYISIHRLPPPPTVLPYSDVKELVASADEARPFLGMAADNVPVYLQLNNESPHILVHALTGAGKSTLGYALLSQELARGVLVVMCDIKQTSHMWARNLPGVAYCSTVEEIHRALIAVHQEVTSRQEKVVQAMDKNLDVGRRIIVVIEELNGTLHRLKQYWSKLRSTDDQKVSPAVEAYEEIAFMGREARIHLMIFGQSVTARAAGGTEVRQQFATRVLMQHTEPAWKMLVPEIMPPPKASSIPGRAFVVVIGKQPVEFQVMLMTDEEARELALSAPEKVETHVVSPSAPDTAEIDMRVTLRQACELEWIPLNYNAARQRKSRDPRFPQGEVNDLGQTVYTREALEAYFLPSRT